MAAPPPALPVWFLVGYLGWRSDARFFPHSVNDRAHGELTILTAMIAAGTVSER